jgi:hypothetical protein
LRLAQLGGPTDLAFVLLSPEDGSRSSFLNVVILITSRQRINSKKSNLHNVYLLFLLALLLNVFDIKYYQSLKMLNKCHWEDQGTDGKIKLGKKYELEKRKGGHRCKQRYKGG